MDTRLRNHIPLAGPATREPCDGSESPLRVSLGFTPKWYRDRLGVDFGEAWHLDPGFRRESLVRMKELLHDEFPEVDYFAPDGGQPCDTISGAFGIMLMSSCYGLPIAWRADNWPDAAGGAHIPKEEIEAILARGPFDFGRPSSLPGGGATVRSLFSQIDQIERRGVPVHGYLNYQGILNVALKVRGNDLFTDLFDDPDFASRLMAHIARAIGDLSRRVQARQRASGYAIDLLSMSNCVMSMVSPAQYEEFVLPLDLALSANYPRFGIHTCNWVIDPYADSLRKIPKMGYIDTGMDSDLARVRRLFPDARRAVLYSPGALESNDASRIAADFERVARDYAPCDIVLADLETTIPSARVREALAMAEELYPIATMDPAAMRR